MTLLFDNIERIYDGPCNQNENRYDYYNRSARSDVSIIRLKLGEWFELYPESEKRELKGRIKDDFESVFYELFLFKLFVNLGFNIEIHPILPDSSKKPDFLISKEGLEIYVEAKVVNDMSREQRSANNVINHFYDSIGKIDSKGFLLQIEKLLLKSKKQPRTKDIIKFFQEEIDKLNPDVVHQEVNQFGMDKMPTIEFFDDDIEITVKTWPVIESARDIEKRPIGFYPLEESMSGGQGSLKDSIIMKAKKYGKLKKPYIICLNLLNPISDKFDVENAIWGSMAISWSSNPENQDEKVIRKRDGVFLDSKGPRRRILSGILVTKVSTHNIPEANYWLFKNPFAENPVNFDQIGLKYSYVDEGIINSVTGEDLDKIIGIPRNWLNRSEL